MNIISNLLLYLLFFSLQLYGQNNFDKYKYAYDYIKADTILIKNGEKFYRINNDDIFVSTEIVRFKRIFFIKDIVKYEYNLTDKREISLMEDSIFHVESERYYNTFILDTLNYLNEKSESKRFVLFFSEIVNNQLSVELIYNYFDFVLPSYKQAIENAGSEETYFFYFDDDNNIVKVFKGRLDF